MNPEIKQSCYMKSLYGLSGQQIAKELGLSEATVSRAINSVTKSLDYKLAMNTVSTFLTDYMKAGDFFKMQIAELEEMKKRDPENYYRIMEMQMERMALIVQLVGQGKIVMALRELRDGKLQLQSDRELTQTAN